MRSVKQLVWGSFSRFSIGRKFLQSVELSMFYPTADHQRVDWKKFAVKNFTKLYVQPWCKNKATQIAGLLKRVELAPVDNQTFFYSIDVFKGLQLRKQIFDNYSVDYTKIVCSSFSEIREELEREQDGFGKAQTAVIDALHAYLQRMKKDTVIAQKYAAQIGQIESLFHRPAESFQEALQRILFFNQFVWQTKHKNNGFGHLDWMLVDLYRADIDRGVLTREDAKALLLDFFAVLHENCWYKSSALIGDTGQIVILGGLTDAGTYCCNELTYLFIEAAMEAKLPDPKVLLRCSVKMPEDLLKLALECIATGIGAPLISNDDAVIPELLAFGYEEKCAYNYATSACWEPLILNVGAEQNNIRILNFAAPMNKLLDIEDLGGFNGWEDICSCYESYLAAYIKKELEELSQLEFEEDPLLSLLSDSALERRKDLLRGGAEYANLGLTTVGLSAAVNSLLNIKRYVFEEKKFSLEELNKLRKDNYAGSPKTVEMLRSNAQHYGSDDPFVLEITNRITAFTSTEFGKYKTKYGGKFKFGVSSPGYVLVGSETEATLDGRKNGEPFMVHISADGATPTTEILSFAAQLDYSGNRINGNVADVMVSPDFLRNNLDKFMLLLRAAFANGLYQMQMNVVDSATIIAARKNPELFPDLIVRVWGFSAYFKDLPEEYQDILVQRAMQSEAALR